MNCESCQERLIEFICGGLAAAEQARIKAHLEGGCRECQEQLDLHRESFAALSLTTLPITPPASLKQQLLTRIRESEQPVSNRASMPVESGRQSGWNWRAFIPYVAVSLVAIMAGVAAVRWTDHRLEQQAELAQIFTERMREAEQTFRSGRMRFASLQGLDASSTTCYLLLDPLANEMHFHALNLGLPEAGKQLELWIVTRDGRYHQLGTLQADASGNCAATLPLPLNLDDVARAVVTEEFTPGATPQGRERISAPFVD